MSLPLGLIFPLLALLGFEFHAAIQTDQRPNLPLGAARIATAVARAEAPDLHNADAAILARPLFSPIRRPAAQSGPARAELPRLSGIMISKAGKFAIFSPAGAKPIIAATGDALGAFTVKAITTTEVTISGPDGLTVLQTSFAGAAAAPANQVTVITAPSPARAISLPGGITLYAPTPADLPSAATWPGLTHVFGLSASQSARLLPPAPK